MKRRILRVTLGLLILLFGNGCYYVFYGQHLSADKLRRGEELNKYEIGSIYSMHLGICAIGWLYSPEATKEIIGMSFKRNRDKVIKKGSDFFQLILAICGGIVITCIWKCLYTILSAIIHILV